MHPGSIHNPTTAAGRVYRVLSDLRGQWIGGWELTQAARTTAVSTRISEVRMQVDSGERVEVEKRGRLYFYRLVRVAKRGQLDLFDAA